jgi:hypothetical protein
VVFRPGRRWPGGPVDVRRGRRVGEAHETSVGVEVDFNSRASLEAVPSTVGVRDRGPPDRRTRRGARSSCSRRFGLSGRAELDEAKGGADEDQERGEPPAALEQLEWPESAGGLCSESICVAALELPGERGRR